MMNARVFAVVGWLVFAGCASLESQGDFAAGRRALIAGDASTALASFQQVARSDANLVVVSGPLRQSIWTYVGRAQYQSGQFVEARETLEKAAARSAEDHMARLYLGLSLLRQPTAPVKPSNALTLQDVSYALREGVERKRVAALARERGVDFDLTGEVENQLRKAGADDAVLNEIKKARAETAQRKQPGEMPAARAAKELAAALAGLRDSLAFTIANTVQGQFWDPSREIRGQIQSALTLVSARELDVQKIISTAEWLGRKLEEEHDRARRDEAEENRRKSRI